MDQVQAMRVFTRIVELQSFSRAAEDLGLPRATVSNVLKRLELRLGVRLLVRTTRRLHVSQEGEIYYQRCLQLLDALAEADALFAHQRHQPAGKVRLDMPHSLAREVVIPALPQFQARYPHIEVLLSANDAAIDLLDHGVDCVLRAWPSEAENLVVRSRVALPQVTCASPGYLATHGTPTSPEALEGHRMVGYFFRHSQQQERLEFCLPGGTQAITLPHTLAVSGADAYLAAGCSGFGLVQAARYSVQAELARGALVEVLAETPPPPMPIYLMYPPGRFVAPRVRVMLEWLAALLQQATAP
ncbi:LysR family transcriptional regulator [Nissabacter sp. SGAir0207]|uniref:LysR family transcriptional regulator n=1 Tax=Nissabacter sp. SGAir0207 TaxID=2126321 RepID=UPI0010CCB4BA|nr:LysR family transcriptional regulator [Nissabacter sp. SGAir0207]QCR37261.1 LysR family transcriptional regulator [Nissabacter sp. SGAir0207]